jgi:hypothetical protein
MYKAEVLAMEALDTETRVAEAVDVLSVDISDALCADDAIQRMDFRLHGRTVGQGDNATRLAALRVLGADALTPFALADRSFDRSDAELFRQAVLQYPAPPADTVGPVDTWRLRDWALGRVLGDLGTPLVELPTGLEPDVDSPGDSEPWTVWSAGLLAVSSLALPGLDSAPRRQSAKRRLDLSRGLSRSIMRKDYFGAARLARWIALDMAGGGPDDPFVESALTHIAVLAGDQPRTRLEVTLAQILLRRIG